MTAQSVLEDMLRARLNGASAEWYDKTRAELQSGVDLGRFCALFSMASRYAPRKPLEPDAAERAAADAALAGWNPERWTSLEAVRVALLMALPDLAGLGGEQALEEAFRYADDGELCALYRSLALLPEPQRFVWRAGEGCRTNIVPVFEAVACDTPFPLRYFDDVAWNQMVIKAVFIGAPLWRVFGLDQRLSPELARMALDLVDERRSAGRAIQPELWLCLGEHAGERGRVALLAELEAGSEQGRQAAVLALGRAGEHDVLERVSANASDDGVVSAARRALAGECGQAAFGPLRE